MNPSIADGEVTVWNGDCRLVLATLPDASVDAVVTDPPYELGFMGRGWDSTGVAYDVDMWREVLRVLRPGGHLLSFGGTRTWHRMVCAIEDAGFEVRDSIAWLYGSGFPKSRDVSKSIDDHLGATRTETPVGPATKRMIPGAQQNRTGTWTKDDGREYQPTMSEPATEAAAEWHGWGTALKPGHEPICVARRPPEGTVAENVLAHRVGALNIDGCRIPVADESYVDNFSGARGHTATRPGEFINAHGGTNPSTLGRWPANVALDEDQAAALDRQSGVLTSGANPTRRGSDKFRDTHGEFAGQTEGVAHRGADSGGASRFFYVAKATPAERPRQGDTVHPTVKPLDLIRWLVRLVTPPGGVVLDPFLGSGTTAEACVREGMRCIGIEAHAPYLALIQQRLARPVQHDLFGGLA